MNKDYKLYAIRDDGRVFSYDDADWILQELTGIDFSEVETFTSAKGVGDGDIITGQRRKSREVNIKAYPKDKKVMATLRASAIAFHNIKHTYDVHIVYLGIHRIAKDCRITAMSMPGGTMHRSEALTVVFLSGDPDLYSDVSVDEELVERSARWKVTRAYLPNEKLLYATELPATNKIIIYEGTNPAPLSIEVVASGYNKNFNITVGEYTANIECVLNNGDVLAIDSDVAFATLNGKMIPYEKAGSFDMRQFRVFNGENRIKIEAQEGDAFRTKIIYTGRYDGV